MFSIIIPTFNRAENLSLCIKSTLKQSYRNFEILVIDNGPSTDNTNELVDNFRKKDDRIKYISTTQKGTIFSRNIGIRNSKGDIFLTLDDDIEFIEKDTLKKSVETFQSDDRIGIVGSIELPSPNTILSHGPETLPIDTGRISPQGELNTSFSLLEGHGITEVDHVRSAFMAVRMPLLKEMGGFDETYNAKGMGFRYETDACMKIKNMGYHVVVNPDIKIWHKGAKRARGFKRGTGFSYFYYANRNHAYFMRRFFWQNSIIRYIAKDILIGAYRTPGIKWCHKRYKNDKNLKWILNALISVLGKCAGNLMYHRQRNK